MQRFNSAYIRAIIAIISGGLLIEYKEEVVNIVTKVVGILFFLSGLISVIIYYVNHNRSIGEEDAGVASEKSRIAGEALPIVGLGSCLLGGVLFFMTEGFIKWVMVIFAAILILGAIGEFMNLVRGGASPIRNFGYWILPSALLIFGITTILYPEAIASAPFAFLGAGIIIYGLSEIINALKIRAIRKSLECPND